LPRPASVRIIYHEQGLAALRRVLEGAQMLETSLVLDEAARALEKSRDELVVRSVRALIERNLRRVEAQIAEIAGRYGVRWRDGRRIPGEPVAATRVFLRFARVFLASASRK
jgi:hypothetical protein